MNLELTKDEAAFRDEVRAFLAEHLPENLRQAGRLTTSVFTDRDFNIPWHKILHAKGWVAPAWPVEYGGTGWSATQRYIWSEETARADCVRLMPFGLAMVGPVIYTFGTPEQKAHFLPRILSGEDWWCQGYSEPGAGSDLAGIQTRAVRDGDDYVVNGSKIWTTGAHHADWCFMVVRTDPDRPKHRGISFLLVDMKSPGVAVQPIINMAGYHEFNQVFFEDVRVPVANRVGEENNGWYVAMTLLDFERSSVASVASNQRLLTLIRQAMRDRSGLRSAVARNRLADLWVANETARLLSYRVAWLQDQGKVPNYEASVIKVLATELAQRIATFAVNLLGLEATLEPDSPHAFARGQVEKGYLNLVAPTIYSGSSEVQRNIIATRGLGLPRD